jgi:hypothetical protein
LLKFGEDFLDGKVPAGLHQIDPKMVRFKGKAVYAPEQVATLFNNTYAPGWSGRPIYDTVRSAANVMNSAQLSLSAFHAGFVTFDTMTSGMAKGIKQISRLTPGEMLEGAKSIIATPVKPFTDYMLGKKVIDQALGTKDWGPQYQSLADALIAGGGRVAMEREYGNSAYGSFWNAFRGELQRQEDLGRPTLAQEFRQMYDDAKLKAKNVTVTPEGRPVSTNLGGDVVAALRVTAQVVPRIMQTISAPIFEHYVPTMKVGVFADMMKDELRVNPEMSPMQLRAAAWRVWSSVDNRLGEMVYDNMFWNKIMKDIGMVSVRSLGWKAGTIREITGGAVNLARGRMVENGDVRQIADNTSYLLAMPIMTAVAGGIYAYLHGTANKLDSIYDYFFPPTGGKNQDGSPERASMLGYMKDAWEWSTGPVHEAQSSLHPWITTAFNMYNNRTYNGASIAYHSGETLLGKVKDYGEFLAKQFEPFNLHLNETEEQEQDSGIPWYEHQLGVNTAPRSIAPTNKGAAYERREEQRADKLKRRQER